MLWFLFAMITAISTSLQDLFRKKSLKYLDAYSITLFSWVFGVPFLLAALFFTGIPETGPNFWFAVIGASFTGTFGMYFYTKAIEEADMSSARHTFFFPQPF